MSPLITYSVLFDRQTILQRGTLLRKTAVSVETCHRKITVNHLSVKKNTVYKSVCQCVCLCVYERILTTE